ncbi:MAG: carbamate kinase [Haloarculaceae archaeon]
MTRAVVAVGGNALCPDPTMPFDRQVETAVRTATELESIAGEYEFALTHGNGPQVGNRLLENEQSGTPALPLDVLVAETQGQLGSILQRALVDAIPGMEFLTIVTHAVVDPDDPAFEDPTKPVGPWYTETEAAEKPFETREVAPDRADGYRRVVPSPDPQRLLEADAIAADVASGYGVVCGGGGGVPVVQREGETEGVAAVIDKDHTSRLVATSVDADELVFLTDVDHVYRDYGTDDQEPFEDVTAAEVREALDAGAFAAGSMKPKMEACLAFLDAGGERAVVCRPGDLSAALDGETGTRIRR